MRVTAVKQVALRSDGLKKCIKIKGLGVQHYYKNAYDIETRSYTCFKYDL